MSTFKASHICTCPFVQSKHVVNNVGMFQESLGSVAGYFSVQQWIEPLAGTTLVLGIKQ